MSSAEHKEKIWSLISEIRIGMLTTQDGKGLSSRPMHIVQDAYDGTLWFFSRLSSGKVDEIITDQDVCLTFQDNSSGVYVSLGGTARVTKDQKLIDKYWNDEIGAWFPEGKESSDCVLIEVKVKYGEHWSADYGKLRYLFEITKANLTGTLPQLGSNQKFG